MLKGRVPVLAVLAVVLVFAGISYASRNSGGTYSLPAGNPVVTGTTITSTWANTTLNDIKNEITNSLDRQGRGGMLAPLQLTNGTAAAPALTFSSEPSSGIYRAGAGDIRASVLTTDVWKWQTAANASLVPLNVTGRTTTTNLTVTGTSASINVVSTTANLYGLQSLGNGTGNGINGQGGATSGQGGNFTGGAPNGIGVVALGTGTGVGLSVTGGTGGALGINATGGASSGGGIKGTGGAANGIGVTGQGTGTGAGVDATGGISSGTGVVARGGAPNGAGAAIQGSGNGVGAVIQGGVSTTEALYVAHGTAATGGTRQTTILSANGDINFTGTAAPSSTTAMSNRLGPTSFAKAWGIIGFNGAGTVASVSGATALGIASVAAATNNPRGAAGQGIDSVDITFATPFADTSYVVELEQFFNKCVPVVFNKTTTVLTLVFVQDSVVGTGTAADDPYANCSQTPAAGYGSAGAHRLGNNAFSFVAYGAQ